MSRLEDYSSLPWHEQRAIRQQLSAYTPLRRKTLARLRGEYQEYLKTPKADLPFLEWALCRLHVDVWNSLFAANARMGSYGAPAVLLEKSGGQYRAVYKR